MIGQEGLPVYQTGDGHPTGDGWILGLAGRISRLIRLGTVPYQTGDGTYGEEDVKEADAGGQGDLRGFVLLTLKKENSIESPLNVLTLNSDVWLSCTGWRQSFLCSYVG